MRRGSLNGGMSCREPTRRRLEASSWYIRTELSRRSDHVAAIQAAITYPYIRSTPYETVNHSETPASLLHSNFDTIIYSKYLLRYMYFFLIVPKPGTGEKEERPKNFYKLKANWIWIY